MALGSTFFIVAAIIIVIWVFIEIKRFKHKIFAMLLIGLILFTYISFTVSLKGEDVDLKTIPGAIKAGKLYWSWLGTVFTNTKSITAYAAKQDWQTYNKSAINETTEIEQKINDAKDIWSKL